MSLTLKLMDIQVPDIRHLTELKATDSIKRRIQLMHALGVTMTTATVKDGTDKTIALVVAVLGENYAQDLAQAAQTLESSWRTAQSTRN